MKLATLKFSCLLYFIFIALSCGDKEEPVIKNSESEKTKLIQEIVGKNKPGGGVYTEKDFNGKNISDIKQIKSEINQQEKNPSPKNKGKQSPPSHLNTGNKWNKSKKWEDMSSAEKIANNLHAYISHPKMSMFSNQCNRFLMAKSKIRDIKDIKTISCPELKSLLLKMVNTNTLQDKNASSKKIKNEVKDIINKKNKKGITPLGTVIENKIGLTKKLQVDIVTFLTRAGADPLAEGGNALRIMIKMTLQDWERNCSFLMNYIMNIMDPSTVKENSPKVLKILKDFPEVYALYNALN